MMRVNFKNRVTKLEKKTRILEPKICWISLFKYGKATSYSEYLPQKPTKTEVSDFGRKNIVAIKKQREALKAGFKIRKWEIYIFCCEGGPKDIVS